MNIEKIQKSEETVEKISSTYNHIIADEGKKFINQGYLDKISKECMICSEVYLSNEASILDWAEITEEEAKTYQEEYNKKLEEENNARLSKIKSRKNFKKQRLKE